MAQTSDINTWTDYEKTFYIFAKFTRGDLNRMNREQQNDLTRALDALGSLLNANSTETN